MRRIIRNVPRHAVRQRKARAPMEIVLHLGAHRTASTVFQYYLRENAQDLRTNRIGVWGPLRTRGGLLTGVIPADDGANPSGGDLVQAQARIRRKLDKLRTGGTAHLVISDENMIGAPRRNLRERGLYGDVGERMSRFAQVFDGRISQVVVSIRSQETYWSSVAAFAVSRGHKVPSSGMLDRLVRADRHWRDVITDLSAAMPDTEILVLPYEVWGGLPERKLSLMTGLATPPMKYAREWMNRAPSLPQLRQILSDRGGDPARLPDGEGRWHPFDHSQTMALREAYADDLFWLRAGADGKATLIEETRPEKKGITPHRALTTRGQTDEIEERRLA